MYCYMVSCIKYRELLTYLNSISSSLLFLLLWKICFRAFSARPRCTLRLPSFTCPPPPVSSRQCVTSVFSLRPLLPPALPVVHSSGWEWTSQLAPLKETHISGCALPLHLSFSLRLKHGPCQCTGWIYHSPSLPLSLCIAARLCCHRYHAAVQVRKGVSGYSSHYWLLNLVMVVKALPVPPCLRGQLMACFMSLQRRASLLGHRFHSDTPPPLLSTLHPRGGTDGSAGCGPPSICPRPRGLTWAAKKKKAPQAHMTPRRLGGPLWFATPDYMKWLELHGVKATIIPGMARAIQQIYGTFQEIVIFYNPISAAVSYSHS